MFRRISLIISTFFQPTKHHLERNKLCDHKSTRSSRKLVLDDPPNWYKVHSNPDPGTTVFTFNIKNLPWLRKWSRPGLENHIAVKSSEVSNFASHVLAIKMDFKVPEVVRGMKTLDRSLFKKSVKIPGIKAPAKTLNVLMKKIRKETLTIRGVKPVVSLDDKDALSQSHKLVLLDPRRHPEPTSFTEAQLELFKDNDVDLSQFSTYDIDLGYENWPADEILRGILPEDQDSVSGFTLIGHIAHLNLKSHLLEYKNVIGEVLLDKTPTVRTVVNKVDTIDNTFRNFNLEVLAGETDFITTAKENGCAFEMDFSKVYWNSRLSTEHQRIVDQLQCNDLVYDVFAGIGPFSIPAAKKRCTVFANDLNPESYKWLQHNVKKNKLKNITTHNLDGRDFIRNVLKPDFMNRLSGKADFDRTCKVHIVMNLPALAVEFLDTFPGLFDLEQSERCDFIEPMVHCYCFSKEEDYVKEVRERVELALGVTLPDDHVIRYVRHVAPKKDMLCAEFRLLKDVMVKKCDGCEPPIKKAKIVVP
ncbi:tRNA (guanine(37)-N1)-methyltransferase-like [Lineus longissimus]|uniref:tRNA (guanine(37)-N1)-methyltransferase-like n=1 Tax=Lineus longissimus TaxID=88925 RepID=UPI002B4C3B7B